jgi:hypothetical protein
MKAVKTVYLFGRMLEEAFLFNKEEQGSKAIFSLPRNRWMHA